MDTSKDRLERLEKRLRGGADVLSSLADEVAAMLSDRASVGKRAKDVVGNFILLWERVHGKYTPNYARDVRLAKPIVSALEVEEIDRRARAYLASTDGFYVEAKHPFSTFCTTINRWGDDTGTARPAVRDCRHVPQCRDAGEHTQKHLAEMRRPRK